MTDIQEKLFDLLVEVDAICRRENITYFLAERTALGAAKIKGFYENDVAVSLCFPPEDYDNFEAAVARENNPRRALESIKTNPKFYTTFAHYVNKDTLYYAVQLSGRIQNPGIHLNIIKLVPYPDKLRDAKIFRFIKEGLGSAVGHNNVEGSQKQNFAGVAVKLLMLIFGKRRVIRYLYDYVPKDPEKTCTQRYYMQNYLKKPVFFPANLFERRKQVLFEGHKFFVPTSFGRYLSARFGKAWSEREYSYLFPTTIVIDPSIPFEQFQKEMRPFDQSKKYLRQRRWVVKTRRKLQPYIDVIRGRKTYLERAQDRYALMDLYLPQKAEIMRLHEKKEYDLLWEKLESYRLIAHKYAFLSIPFAFDPDYYDLLTELLQHQKQNNLSSRLKSARDDAMDYLDYVSCVPKGSVRDPYA